MFSVARQTDTPEENKMANAEFIVTVSSADWDSWALESDEVYRRLTDAIGYSGVISVDSVKPFNRADYVFTRTGKIAAIKAVRSLLSCSLPEAKTLVDAAANRAGATSLFGVTIDYDPSYG